MIGAIDPRARRLPLTGRGDRLADDRVLRGGAFNNNQNNVRCAYRNRINPNNRNRNNGFRVVVSTFFTGGSPRRNCGAGAASTRRLRHRGEKNGGAGSWPRSEWTISEPGT